jgi:uroporphyrinogen decarboxylase
MDGKERVTRALERRRPDRIPIYDSPWEDSFTRWHSEGLPKDVAFEDYFDFDIDILGIDTSPRLPMQVVANDGEYITYRDRFGYTVRKSVGKSRTMHFSDHYTVDRAAWEALKRRWIMDPADSTARLDDAGYFMHLDPYPTYQEARAKVTDLRRSGRYMLFNLYGPYEATWRHRGFERFLMDLAEDPDFAAEMADFYMDFAIQVLRRCLDEDLVPDGVFVVEDIAYKDGLLMGPRTWRRVFKPQMQKLGAFLKEQNVAYWMHSCGNGEAVFDDLIECGLDVIQPLEAKTGLDVRRLASKYGDRLTFWGNVDVVTMANGSDAEIEEEIRSKLAPFMAAGGGYIYHSDHSVPPEVSFPRFKQVMELVRKYGTY